MDASDPLQNNDRKRAYSILLINPSLDTRQYTREDRLRTYLSLGTLASAIRDRNFVGKFARVSGRLALLRGPNPGGALGGGPNIKSRSETQEPGAPGLF